MSGPPIKVPLPGHSRLRLNSRSARVTVVAEDRADLLIESGIGSPSDVEDDGNGHFIIQGGSKSLELRCPAGTDLVIGTLSGNVEVTGRAGAVLVGSASGSISVERALTADLRSLSGNVTVGACDGRCRVSTKSGRASVGRTGQTEVSTMSGSVSVASATGDVRVKSASGRVEVGSDGRNDVAVSTMSGSVTVRLPDGVRPAARLRSLSGRPRCDCPAGDDCQVAVSTMSGKIEVVPGG